MNELRITEKSNGISKKKSVPIKTSSTDDTYKQILKATKDKGLLKEQDFIRMAVAHQLKVLGYR